MSFTLTYDQPEEIITYLLNRDHPDTPPSGLPTDWVYDTINTHFEQMITQRFTPDTDYVDTLIGDPDPHLTELLLIHCDHIVSGIEVTPITARTITIGDYHFKLPMVFIDLYGVMDL